MSKEGKGKGPDLKAIVRKIIDEWGNCFERKQDEVTKKYYNQANPVKLETWRVNANAGLNIIDEHDSPDKGTLIEVMKFMLARKVLPIEREYQLNELEGRKCDSKCTALPVQLPPSLPAKAGESYPYYRYFDENRGLYVCVTFIKREIPGNEQIDEELARKIADGWKPEQSEYAKTKTLWRRVILNENEWLKYFKESGETVAEQWFA